MRRGSSDVGTAVVAGAIAGTLAGIVMAGVQLLARRALLDDGASPAPAPKRVVTHESAALGHPLHGTEARVAAAIAHLAYAAGWGALYGAVHRRIGLPLLPEGLLFGAAVYALNFWGVLPARGIIPLPTRVPLAEAAIPWATHATFGLGTAAAYRALEYRARGIDSLGGDR